MSNEASRNLGTISRRSGQRLSIHAVALVVIGIVLLLLGWYAIRSANLDIQLEISPGVAIVGSAALGAAAIYLLSKFTIERIIFLMVLTLPLVSALIIDIGGSIRVNYILALLAVFVGLYTRRLHFPFKGWTLTFLIGFVVYAVFSASYTLWLPDFTAVTNVGFRGLPIRSVIQSGQLVLMVLVFYLVLNYATSTERLSRLCNVIFWSLVLVVGYSTYEFLTVAYGLPFFGLETSSTYDFHVATIEREFVGISIPRPHATFPEPIDLAGYLVFAIPFAIVANGAARTALNRLLRTGLLVGSAALFIVVNSRAGFVAAAGAIPLVLLLAPGARIKVQLLMVVIAMFLIVGFILFPLLGASVGFSRPVAYFKADYQTLISLQDRGFNEEAVRVFKIRPATGVGIGNYPFYIKRPETLSGGVSTTGSLYLRLLAELGLIGTVLFCAFVLSILVGLVFVVRQSRDIRLRRLGFAALVAIVGLLLVKAGTVGIFSESHMWVAFAMGLAVVRLHTSRALAEPAADARRSTPPATVVKPEPT